ncbi:MAG: hypothetical protein ABH872_00700 [Candidatus Omnitrophota bacterium]
MEMQNIKALERYFTVVALAVIVNAGLLENTAHARRLFDGVFQNRGFRQRGTASLSGGRLRQGDFAQREGSRCGLFARLAVRRAENDKPAIFPRFRQNALQRCGGAGSAGAQAAMPGAGGMPTPAKAEIEPAEPIPLAPSPVESQPAKNPSSTNPVKTFTAPQSRQSTPYRAGIGGAAFSFKAERIFPSKNSPPRVKMPTFKPLGK